CGWKSPKNAANPPQSPKRQLFAAVAVFLAFLRIPSAQNRIDRASTSAGGCIPKFDRTTATGRHRPVLPSLGVPRISVAAPQAVACGFFCRKGEVKHDANPGNALFAPDRNRAVRQRGGDRLPRRV